MLVTAVRPCQKVSGNELAYTMISTACTAWEKAKANPRNRRSRSSPRVKALGTRVASEEARNVARNNRNDVRAVTRIALRNASTRGD